MTFIHSIFGPFNRPAINAASFLASLVPWDSFKSQADFVLTAIDPLLGLRRTAAQVVAVVDEAPGVKSYLLKPASRWQGFMPGQFVTVEVDIGGIRYRRNYSISSACALFAEEGLFSITVKQVENGRVSGYFQQKIKAGMNVHISEANGQFVLPEHDGTRSRRGASFQAPPVFLAAGSGITPVMAMLEALAEHDQLAGVELVYIVRSEADVIFSGRLQAMMAQHPDFRCSFYFSGSAGRPDAKKRLEKIVLPAQRHLYICGPQAFMNRARDAALGLGFVPDNIHTESFGVGAGHKAGSTAQRTKAKEARVRCELSGRTLEGGADMTLLELAERAGMQPRFCCRSGICHECTCTRSSGRLLNALTGSLFPQDQSQVQACISVPLDEVTIDSW